MSDASTNRENRLLAAVTSIVVLGTGIYTTGSVSGNTGPLTANVAALTESVQGLRRELESLRATADHDRGRLWIELSKTRDQLHVLELRITKNAGNNG